MDYFNQLPCPVLVTDANGCVLAANTALLTLVGGTQERWLQKLMDQFMPPASCMFLQTHVWPMLLRQGAVQELRLYLLDTQKQRIPVVVNCQRGDFSGVESYYWVFFITLERSRFETELLNARSRAEASALVLAKSEHFIKTITDAIPSLIAYWDQDMSFKTRQNVLLSPTPMERCYRSIRLIPRSPVTPARRPSGRIHALSSLV